MKKKVFALSLALGALALILSAGTMAYFTDRTDPITNTFTVGLVDIELTEAEDWSVPTDHTFMPGSTFDKTPTITVTDDSQDAYVFAQIELNNFSDFVSTGNNWANHTDGVDIQLTQAGLLNLLGHFVEGFDADKWQIVGGDLDLDNDKITITAAYKEKLSAGKDVVIFNKVKMPENVKSEDLIKSTIVDQETGAETNEYATFADSYIKITAAAIQAEGFADYVEAGNALADQWGISF